MHVLHVCPAYYPATYWGGPTFSTYYLCNALARLPGVTLEVLATDTAGPSLSDRVPVSRKPMLYDEGYPVWFCSKVLGVDIAPGILPRLWKKIQKADVVHVSATYSFTTLPALALAKWFSKPVVWSPRGAIQATDEWSGAGNLKAKKIFHSVARYVAPPSVLFHATSAVEAAACQRNFPKFDVFVSPNGVACPEQLPPRPVPDHFDQVRLIFLGRLHEKKGLDVLLRAMRALPDRFYLDIYGTGEVGFVNALNDQIRGFALERRVKMHGSVDGASKQHALFNSDMFVLPSHSENFGNAVAEALAHGLPVVVSRNTPWELVEQMECGAWVENTPEAFSAAILRIASKDLRRQGQLGHSWMKNKFSWDALAHDMVAEYRTLAMAKTDRGR